MTTTERNQQAVSELAAKIKKFGYDVYISNSGTYGFFTPNDGQRVISFQVDYFFFSFSINHNSVGMGSGYRITSDEQCLIWELDKFCTADFLQKLVNAPIYKSRRKNEMFLSWTTLNQYLARYQSSSKYTKQ